jgi:glucosamine--fructose-6-phosphate aminotransferase (isomerizing)
LNQSGRSPSLLLKDMLETPALLRGFDPGRMTAWGRSFREQKFLLVTGEGSSRIFPAQNLRKLNMQRGQPLRLVTEGARQAAEYALEGAAVLGVSSSGQTRELVDLFAGLKTKGTPGYAVTAPGSRLAAEARDTVNLACGPEGGVAATKTVVEQALLCQALLQGDEWKNKNKAAELAAGLLGAPLPAGLAEKTAGAGCLYIAGRNDGVAEELALKAAEIARKRAIYLEGTLALHGIEETVQSGDMLLLVEPFASEIPRLQSIFAQGLGLTVAAIASFETPFPTIAAPRLEGFDGYLRLTAGWALFAAAGLAAGIDIDRPARARKIGNAV